MALTPGVELLGVGPPGVACQLEDSHDVDIHTVKESVNNNNNNNNNNSTAAGQFDAPVGLSSQSGPDISGGLGW